SLDERQHPQIFAVEVQHVKRDEDALTTAKKQITKDWASGVIDASYLTIEYRTFDAEMFSDPSGKLSRFHFLRSVHLCPPRCERAHESHRSSIQRETRLNQTALCGGKAVSDASCAETCTKYKAEPRELVSSRPLSSW